jgi:lipase
MWSATPLAAIAGERSRDGWNVPAWAEDRAASFHVVQGAGHMMMLEDGDGFGQLLARTIKSHQADYITGATIPVGGGL